jgi:hypothetical protein
MPRQGEAGGIDPSRFALRGLVVAGSGLLGQHRAFGGHVGLGNRGRGHVWLRHLTLGRLQREPLS